MSKKELDEAINKRNPLARPVPAVDMYEQAPEELEPDAGENRERSAYLLAVDAGGSKATVSISMYTSRHEQLRYIAYIENRKIWQIVEDALEEYVAKHYKKKKT